MRPLDYSIAEARTFLAEGSPGAADAVLWEILARNPRNAEAWGVLAEVAAAVGNSDFAARFSAVAAALGAPQAASAPDMAHAASPASVEERYLIIKAWGYGFCSDLDHTVAGLLLAEMSGRTPVTHWGSNSLFSVDPKEDAFRAYFEPVSPVRLDDVLAEGPSASDFWPPKWNPENLREERLHKQMGPYSRLSGLQLLNRPERIVVADYHLSVVHLTPWIRRGHPMHGKTVDEILRYLFAKYIRPLPDIRDEVETFAAEHFRTRPIIGVHARGSDKYKEDPQHQQRLAMYPQAIDFFSQGAPQCPIFLITDSEVLLQEYQQRYGPRLIVPPAQRTSSQVGVHHLGHADRRMIGKEVVRDIYLAAKCDKFIGLGSSNVTATINHLKVWPPGSTIYLSHLLTHKPDPYQYLSFDQLARYFGREWVERMKTILV